MGRAPRERAPALADGHIGRAILAVGETITVSPAFKLAKALQSQSRRLSKDYELLCSASEALIYIAMSRLMLRRLARRL